MTNERTLIAALVADLMRTVGHLNKAAPAAPAEQSHAVSYMEGISDGRAEVKPALVPLTLEQINRIDMATEWPENALRNIGPRSWGQLLVCVTRAIEAAHGIKP